MKSLFEKYMEIAESFDADLAQSFAQIAKTEFRMFRQLSELAKKDEIDEALQREYDEYLLRDYGIQQCLDEFPKLSFKEVFHSFYCDLLNIDASNRSFCFEFNATIGKTQSANENKERYYYNLPFQTIYNKCRVQIASRLSHMANNQLAENTTDARRIVSEYLHIPGVFLTNLDSWMLETCYRIDAKHSMFEKEDVKDYRPTVQFCLIDASALIR